VRLIRFAGHRRGLSSYHAIPSFYRKLLVDTLIGEAGGRLFPEWSPETSLETMSELNIGTAILSVSTPCTAFLPGTADAIALACDVNDYLADLVKAQPDRFGFFATIPLPPAAGSAVDQVRHAISRAVMRGVVRLVNSG
jgi:6-methylsalicylate decarboxylase